MRWSIVAIVLALGCVAAAAEDQPVRLPVTRITLYAGGAAFVEHQSALAGDTTIELRIKADQVPAVLRSILVLDGEGGKVAASVACQDAAAAQASEDRKLSLKDSPTQAEILDELRGVKVRIACGEETFRAAIVSVESRPSRVAKAPKAEGIESETAGNAENAKASAAWLNVVGEDGVRSIPLEKISRIDVEDPAAQRQLSRALRELWPAAEQERQSILVRVSGSGERTIKLGYAMQTQPWKMSYRLLLSDKPSLQAWATVSNDTDQPWNQVKLNLLSGLPVMLAGEAGGDAGAIAKSAKAAGVPAGQSLRRPMPLASREALDGSDPPAKPRPRDSMVPDAPLANPGEAFRFAAERVAVPPQGSAAIAVLNEPIAIERVSIFNDALVRRNPLQGALMKNSLKQYLPQGTVTVLDEGAFAGEGRLENLAPGRSALVSWGVDLPVLVDASENTHSSAVQDAHIVKGVLQVSQNHRYVRQYLAENEDRTDRVLIIEHPIRRGWKLFETPEPFEVTETHYRFRLAVPSGKQVKLTVTEQTSASEPIDLAAADVHTLRPYAQDEKVRKDVRDTIERVIQLKQRAAEAQRRLETERAEARRITQEQARLRANLQAAGDSGPLREKLREKLAETEKQLDRLQNQLQETQQILDTAQRDLQGSFAA